MYVCMYVCICVFGHSLSCPRSGTYISILIPSVRSRWMILVCCVCVVVVMVLVMPVDVDMSIVSVGVFCFKDFTAPNMGRTRGPWGRGDVGTWGRSFRFVSVE